MVSGPGGEPAARDLVPLGVVVAPHGVQGEVAVKLHNPASTLLESRRALWLRDASGVRRVSVRAAHRHKQGLRVALAGCDTRDAAEALRRAELCVTRQELPRLADGEAYLVDLVGLEARTPAGERVGVVEDAVAYPAATVLRVQCADGVREVPAFAPYLVEARPSDGIVVVDRIEDLDVLRPSRRARSGG